ncbi:TrkA-N domain protein [Thermotoga neapolitana LA10]|uniref:Trk system potassium uptake protein TrkA n=1 Tax=Thermotoga neapolitana (strain ATCC 49049 / DSM 4359 / NBRC 107923 / NS-E) TaxID=309803 RepID=B9K9M3_THENN|nr:TrkA-N domain protein [Thermotoga neapolitana DSM 4359]AJG41553.1 potassium transporter TrkA [Thermotoga sp. RQ7]KFZ21277.1 TrkA-N domain protein [Thermotoga neapolitana LA10]HBF10301.1 TrkA family potassium uptake protein [Thermotoga neapolitana]
MKVIIIGGETTAYYLARSMTSRRYGVVLINKDRELCEEFAKKLKATVIHGDGSQKEVLRDAEPSKNDVVVILTPRDEVNLFIAQLAMKEFGVRRVVSLVNDPGNIEIFKRMGITTVLNLTTLITNTVEALIFPEEFSSIVPLEQGIEFLNVTVDEENPVAGKKLKDLNLPRGSIVAAIVRGGVLVVPRGDTEILPGDKLYVITNRETKEKVEEVLLGR